MRSGRNYPHLLADRLGARLTDLTVSGATTETILDKSQRTLRGKRFGPQINRVPSDAALITVTAGGNDLGYMAAMIVAAYAGWLGARRLTRPFGRILERRSSPAATQLDFARVETGLVSVVEAARNHARRARIVLVDCLTVLGDHDPGDAAPLGGSDADALREVARGLVDTTARAAQSTGADLIQASALSVDHGLGSPDPWITGFRPSMRPMPFHPTADGMRAVADALYQLLASNSLDGGVEPTGVRSEQ
jgi:lysophospholipase L1-like esterase